MPLTLFGSEIVASPAGSSADYSSMTALADGRFVAAWRDISLHTPIMAQLFNADGSKSGNAFIVNTGYASTTEQGEDHTAVTALADGGFVISWTFADFTSVAQQGVNAQRFNAAGQPVGGEFSLDQTRDEGQYISQLATLSDGRFVAIWDDSFGHADLTATIRVRIFNADGSEAVGQFAVNLTETATAFTQARVAALGDGSGGFAVSWLASGNVITRIFGADGLPDTGEIIVSSSPGAVLNPQITSLAGGNLFVLWQDLTPGSGALLHGRILQPDGAVVGSELLLNSAVGRTPDIHSVVTELRDGRIAVAGAETDSDGWGIWVQLFNQNGTPDGDSIRVNTEQTGFQDLPHIVELADGRLYVTWENGSASDLRAQIVDPRGAAITLAGTTLNDDLIGTAFADDIHGGVGNDRLDVGAGDDTVHGDGGNDYLIDRGGNDTIDGGDGIDTVDYSGAAAAIVADLAAGTATGAGAGADTLASIENVRGGNGNDHLTGNAAANVLAGNSGDDMLDGGGDIDTADYSSSLQAVTVDLGGGTASGGDAGTDTLVSIENVDGGAGNDNVTGNAQANIFRGNAGDDTIFAGGGHDVVTGGDGNDTLVGNVDVFASESDSLDGGHGNDTIYGEFTDTVSGGIGHDVLYAVNDFGWSIDLAATGFEFMRAGFGDDTLDAASQTADVEIFAGGGNDVVNGGAGNDFLWGENGSDTLTGSGGNDVLFGAAGSDGLSGGDGNDALYVDAEDTSFDGGADFDALYITSGTGRTVDMAATHFEWVGDFAGANDGFNGGGLTVRMEAYAGGGNDSVTGGSEADFLWGEAGSDAITGNGGDDVLVGGAGIDILNGGAGIDTLYMTTGGGGDGAVDTAIYDAAGWGTDFVFDFEHGIDKINLHGTGATVLTVGITSVGGHAWVQFGADLIVVANQGGVFTASDIVF